MERSYTPKASEIKRAWHLIDATGQPLGRVATRVATLLRGKHKPMFAPHMDVGDYVVVINAAQVAITGKGKPLDKMYYHHSGYPGGLRSMNLQKTLVKFPERVLERAVRGMLPKNSLGRAVYRKLHVYAGAQHPHQAQFHVANEAQRLPEPLGVPSSELTPENEAQRLAEPPRVPSSEVAPENEPSNEESKA
jgi:large subunit ribosomal protein L13